MTYYQACCTLVAVILAVAIHTDPVVNYIFTKPVDFFLRLTFGIVYWLLTFPSLVRFVMWVAPVTAFTFYLRLMTKYFEIYPEAADDNFDGDN